ncbi:MAG: helix-turn-helix domain-containing protein [Micrococcales bacterium]|nr:helix-turn-helix domain-containing protein [Micrococcales bacterium]
MPNKPEPDVGQDPRWAHLLRQVRAERHHLVADFVELVQDVEAYAEGAVPAEVINADAVRSFDYLLDRMEGRLPLGDTGPALDLGADRARRRVPLDDLMSAIRSDFTVVWRRMRLHVPDEQVPLLVEHVDQLWHVIEEYTKAVQRAYLREQALMAQEQEDERSALITRLLEGPVTDRLASSVELALGLTPSQRMVVLVAPAARRRELARLARELHAEGRGAHWQSLGLEVLLLVPWRGDLAAANDRLAGIPCIVGPIATSAVQLRESVEVARLACGAMPADVDRPITLRDVWPSVAVAAMGAAGRHLVAEVLDRLEGLPPGERGRLVETVRLYLARGSVNAVAAEAYCHRNTVLNRLGRVRELTGCDVTVPREAALLELALAAEAQESAGDGRRVDPAAPQD